MSKVLSLHLGLLFLCLVHVSTQSALLNNAPEYDQPLNQVFFPSIPGSWWTYDATRQIFGHPDTITSEATFTIEATDTLPSGIAAARWRVSLTDNQLAGNVFPFGEDSIIYIAQSGDSVWLYKSIQDTLPPQVLLLFPLVIGQTWGEDAPLSFVNSLDSIGTVAVTAGVFDSCIHLTKQGGWWQAPVHRSEWLKQSIGFIRIDHVQMGLINLIFSLRLRAYHLQATSTEEPGLQASPLGFALEQNYPNPFNPVTLIRYSIPRSAHVTLKLYDILGRQVSSLLDRLESPGTHDIRLDASALPAGVYFYRLHTDKFIATRRLLYLK